MHLHSGALPAATQVLASTAARRALPPAPGFSLRRLRTTVGDAVETRSLQRKKVLKFMEFYKQGVWKMGMKL